LDCNIYSLVHSENLYITLQEPYSGLLPALLKLKKRAKLSVCECKQSLCRYGKTCKLIFGRLWPYHVGKIGRCQHPILATLDLVSAES